MINQAKSIAVAIVVAFATSGGAFAFPSWLGVYGTIQRHGTGNPGTFTILMNQDYVGLRAEVGVQVDGGAWTAHPMTYAGNISGNSKWELTPAAAFPAGTTVKYYFHGYDSWGGNIWDSASGANYSFTAETPSGLQFSGAQSLGLSGPGGAISDACVSGDKIYALAGALNIGSVVNTGVVWTGWLPGPGGRVIEAHGQAIVAAYPSGGDLVITRSTDGGATFGAPVTTHIGSGTIHSIDIASMGSQFIIFFAYSPDAAYYNARDLFCIRSDDNGATWAALPLRVDGSYMGWFDGLQAGANSSRFFLVYRYVEQVYSTSIRAAQCADGISWNPIHLFGDKAGSTFDALVTTDSAYVALDPYYDNVTRFARFNGSGWDTSTVAHPDGYTSGRNVKLANSGEDAYFLRSQTYPSTSWDIRKSNDQGMNWAPAGILSTPEGVPSFTPFLQDIHCVSGRVHLVWVNNNWRYGANLWQVSIRNAGGPVNWVGDTHHWPANSALTSTNNLWINTESWPAGNGVAAGIVYNSGGTNWYFANLSRNGRDGANDKWNVNLGQFFSGTTIRYAVWVEDGNGVKRWDNNGGQDFRAIVQSNPNIVAPFFHTLDPYRGDLERVRANGRAKNANFHFGSFASSESVTITARPIEGGNGASVQFGPVEMVSYLVYATNPNFANAATVYGDFRGGGLSNKPIFDFTSFSLGSFPSGTTVHFWIGSSNSKGSGYAQNYGQLYTLDVQ